MHYKSANVSYRFMLTVFDNKRRYVSVVTLIILNDGYFFYKFTANVSYASY